MKKIASFILAGFLILGIGNCNLLYTYAACADREVTTNIFNRMGVPSATLESGETVYFIDNDGQAFYVPSGAKVTFTINLKSSGTVELGYKKNSGSKVRTYSGTGKSHTTTFTIGSTGYYKFYITNKSSGTISISGGNLTF